MIPAEYIGPCNKRCVGEGFYPSRWWTHTLSLCGKKENRPEGGHDWRFLAVFKEAMRRRRITPQSCNRGSTAVDSARCAI